MLPKLPRFVVLALCSGVVLAQTSTDETSAATALYRSGKFAEAQHKFEALVKADPKQPLAQSGLVRALLAQEKVEQAADVVASANAAMPDAEPIVAALGEVQFRQAQMQDAEKSLLRAARLDPKDPLPLLALAELYDAYSLHRRAYDNVKRAHDIAPDHPEVQRAWFHRLPRKERLEALEHYLQGPHPDDEESNAALHRYLEFLKATVDKPAHACRLVTNVEATSTKLQPLMVDARRLRGYGLAISLNERKAKLLLDTGASGLVIGRGVAEKAGAVRISQTVLGGVGDKGVQSGYTAAIDRLRIGDLEFHDCIVRVSERKSVADEDGLIGADVFARYLVDLDLPSEKLNLTPLPKRIEDANVQTSLDTEGEEDHSAQESASASDGKPDDQAGKSKAEAHLPKDAYVAPEMAKWSKVFRFGHELLIPTLVSDSKPMLFLIDTGAFNNVLDVASARRVSKVRGDDMMRVRGLSGSVKQVYRTDKATLQFGHLRQENQDTVTFDLSNISRHTGTEVSGILGFAMLRLLDVKIDYRDGLVNFTYDAKRWGFLK